MASDFSHAGTCVAVYRFENGALTVDSSAGGTNTLTAGGAPVAATGAGNFKEGLASVDLEKTGTGHPDYFSIPDASLPSGFPLLNGSSNLAFTITGWFNQESSSVAANAVLWEKSAASVTYRNGLLLRLGATGGKLQFYLVNSGLTTSGLLSDHWLTTGQWYFFGVTFDGVSKWQLYLWDDVAAAWIDEKTLTQAFVPICSNHPMSIGTNCASLGGSPFDGKLDEFTVWNTALNYATIIKIKDGEYTTPLETTPTVFCLSSGRGSSLIYRPIFAVPMWPAKETLSFKTNIIRLPTTSLEQRICLRRIPRQRFDYDFILGSFDERTRNMALTHYNLKKKWGVPVWTERMLNAETLAASGTTINVDTRYSDYRDGSYALVWQSPTKAEVVRIDTHTDDALTLKYGLVDSYSGNKFVMPMRFGYARKAGRIRQKNGMAVLNMDLECIDNEEILGYDVDSGEEYELCLRYSQLSEGDEVETEEDIDPDGQIVDNGTGLIRLDSLSEFNIVSQLHQLQYNTKADIWDFRQWLHYNKGRQRAFLIPTMGDDLTLTRAVGAVDDTIYVSNVGLASYVGVNDMLDRVAFLKTDGTFIVKTITAIATVSATEESVELDSAVGTAFASGGHVMFVDKCRLASDDIVLEWVEPNSVRTAIGLVKVQQ